MAMDRDSKIALISGIFLAVIIAIFVLNGGCEPSEESILKMELSAQIYEAVKEKALIPDSTNFQDNKVYKTDKGYTVIGTFETKNAYGTMIPHKYSAEFNKDKKLIKLDIY